MLTITNPVFIEEFPRVIVCTSKQGEPYNSEIRTHDGPLARVRPVTGKDLMLMRMFEHGVDYFAPAYGEGLLVKPHLLKA